LQNVHVKINALEDSLKGKLPLKLRSIVLGRLFIKIPWLHLSSEPLSIMLEDVFILTHPKQTRKYTFAEEEEMKKAARKALLEELDKTTTLESGGTIFAAATEQYGFLRALIMKCIDNIQIEVNRLHIVYQDDGHSIGVSISFIFFLFIIYLFVCFIDPLVLFHYNFLASSFICWYCFGFFENGLYKFRISTEF